MLRGLLVLPLVVGCSHNHGNSVNTLVRVDAEAPGENCTNGGLAIHTGQDLDHNGEVDDAEITATHYACNGAGALSCDGATSSLEGVVVVQDATDLAQLSGVTCIDGDLVIAGYDGSTLTSVDSLQRITGSVTIAGNAALESLAGLASLTEIGRTYSIQGNDALTDIASIGQLTKIGSVIITGNGALVDLAGFEVWSELKPHLTISNNNALESLHGLENIVLATNNINIQANRSLTSVAALDGVKIVGVFDISGNDSLTSVSLSSLQKINTRLIISANPALTSVSLPALATASSVALRTNPVLQSIDLSGLIVTNDLAIATNSALTTISAPSLTAVTQRVDLLALPALMTLQFPQLQTIGESLVLSGVTQLTDISGLAALRKVAGDFTVKNCNALTNFQGLVSLDEVAGNLLVQTNAALASFTGMQGSLATVGGNLSILDNPQLPPSEAQAFASSVSVSGTVTID